MPDSPRIHELGDDLATFIMHGFGYRLPACRLFIGEKTGRICEPLPDLTGMHPFADNQTSACPLAIVFCHQRGRMTLHRSAIARHRGHDKAVGDANGAISCRLESKIRYHLIYLFMS